MENTFSIGLTRQATLRRKMDVVANNIANMNTTGFMAERTMFVDHLVKSRSSGVKSLEPIAYVRDIATYKDFSEGTMIHTGNALDVAINGEGFLTVQTENGERYTRNGHLRLDQDGQLVTNNGDSVLSDNGAPFFFAPGDGEIEISGDGTISTNNGALGRLRIVQFDNPHLLIREAGGYFSGDNEPVNVANPQVVQGMLEGSNVEPIIEMTRMIDVHRSYQGIAKLLESEDQRERKMLRVLGGEV